MTDIQKLIAKDLLKIKAVFFRPDEPFTWASGIKSPVYCDNRLTLTAPEVRTDVENALAETAPPFRLAGNECCDPQVLTETDEAGGDSRGRVCQTEPQTRKGTGYREAHSSVTPYTCETEIPFGRQLYGGSDNAMSSARASVFGMAWWPNGMEVR